MPAYTSISPSSALGECTPDRPASCPIFEADKNAPVSRSRSTRRCIVSLLSRLAIPFPDSQYDHEFDKLCRETACKKGYPMDGAKQNLAPFIPGGVVMATTAYAHLPNKETRIMIALYTAFLIYLDDVFQYDINMVSDFNNSFIHGMHQGDPVLDSFAALLRELPEHYGKTVSNIMVTSTLNLVTALLLEYEARDMPLQSGCALGYPTFSRVMSGASEAYGLFVFPGDLQLPTFIQALPEMMVFINNGNDVLSFYKEELAGETVNRVSYIADVRGVSKHEALQDLVDEAVEAHSRVLGTLAPHDKSLAAFRAFTHGYVGFHAGLKNRYRLQELNLA